MNNLKLLSRKEFKTEVFKRDKNLCLVCKEPAVDAHHLVERKLWEDGGYYLDNGTSLCSGCHLKAEQTIISCDELRNLAGIKNVLLPIGWDATKKYSKWGDILNDDGSRMPGPFFNEEGVQKILKHALHLYRVF